MSTLLDVIANLASALDTELGLVAADRMASDYRDDLDAITVGQTRYQLRHQYQQDIEGNVIYQAAAIEIKFYHALDNLQSESAYTEDASSSGMHAQMTALLSRRWWTDNVPGIREIEDGPDVQDDVTREGNVVSWSVLIAFLLTP